MTPYPPIPPSSVAEQLYTQALSYGENYAIFFSRGRNRHKREHYTDALENLNRAIEIYKDDSDYFYWRARTYYKLEQYDKAADDIDNANQLNPGDKYIHSLRKAIANEIARQGHERNKHQQTAEAVKQFDTAIALEPENAIFRYNKALALIESNKNDSEQMGSSLYT